MKIHSPLPEALASEFNKAASILDHFIKGTNKMDQTLIPAKIVANCKGVAVLTLLKAGFVWSGRAGAGLVVARLPDGRWSAPCAIGAAGAGFGAQIGAELTDCVFILNTESAVRAFSHGGNLTLGANISVAAGPVGRQAEGAGTVANLAPIYSYSKTKGLFAGLSLEGLVIIQRKETNASFYGQKVTPRELLSGQIEPPPGAEVLYRALTFRGFGSQQATPEASTGSLTRNPSTRGSQPLRRNSAPKRFETSQQSVQSHLSAGGSSTGEGSAGNSRQNLLGARPPANPPLPVKSSAVRGFSAATTTEVPPPPSYESSQSQGTSRPPIPAKPSKPSNLTSPSTQTPGYSPQNCSFPRPVSQQPAVPVFPQGGGFPKPSELRNANLQGSNGSVNAPPAIPQKLPPRPAPRDPVATALYDFAGEREGDLSFKRGEKITVTKKTDSVNDWWEGKTDAGRVGAFPANYVSI
ncbi:hypothetical protein HDU97_006126 [Phlyctochytrium planicorne]|nr:hypothetical protein HDU97_006126 [Phlyctochytrium planicorne]